MLGLGRGDGLVGGKGGLKVGVMAGSPSRVLLAGESPGILCAFPAVSVLCGAGRGCPRGVDGAEEEEQRFEKFAALQHGLRAGHGGQFAE